MKETSSIAEHLEVRYGLPAEVKFCTRCVLSNQRPLSTNELAHTADSRKLTLHFDEQGVCQACRAMDDVFERIDWKQREQELVALLDRHRRTDGRYDCLVPGSGGKDSAMAAHVLKSRYGMHPLTVTWAPHLYTDIGWKNYQSWIHVGGFDNYLFTPNGRVHRLLTRLATLNLFHPFQPFIIGQKTFAPKMALMHDIPLVFYGEMPAQYGERMSTSVRRFGEDIASPGFQLKHHMDDYFLGGVPAREIVERHGVSEADLQAYLPAPAERLERAGIEFHYLGYYVKWVPQEAYYYAVEHTGFQANPQRTEGTYSKYNSLDDKIDGFFYWTTYIKFGLGRATFDASQEIRNRHLTREEGVALVKRFDGEFPRRYAAEIFEYLGMTDEEFLDLADKFRSPHLWKKEGGEWKLRHTIWESAP